MRNTVSYEWDYLDTDENGDIQEHNHADKLSMFNESDRTQTLELVRDAGNEIDGLNERTFAAVKDGQLPLYFNDAYGNPIHLVPKRFHAELAKHLNK